MWFDSWYDLARILVVGPVAYAVLVAVLRLTDKRTLQRIRLGCHCRVGLDTATTVH